MACCLLVTGDWSFNFDPGQLLCHSCLLIVCLMLMRDSTLSLVLDLDNKSLWIGIGSHVHTQDPLFPQEI